MATSAGRIPAGGELTRVGRLSRIYGLGSIYGKTLRDSRLAVIVVGGLLGGLMVIGGEAYGKGFASAADRASMAAMINDMPAAVKGLGGNPINVATMGGAISWKYGPFFAMIAGLWSVMALSGTLAGEARSGSLDMVAAAPFGKMRIAIEKLAAHLTGMAAAMAFLALCGWLVGIAFAALPGDEIPPQAAIGFALWVGLIGLACGSVAFALGPILGRRGAAGIGATVLLAGYFLSGYQASVPVLAPPAHLTFMYWTYNHVPLAGQYDWFSLVPVAVAAAVLLVVGVASFARRDLGQTANVRGIGLPASTMGLRGPLARSLGDQLPITAAWGIGIGLWGLLIAAVSKSFADEVAKLTGDAANFLKAVAPSFDITSPGGFLQLVFVELGFVVVGLAAATLVATWASDETSGRLEMLLATPLARARWAIASGGGVLLAILGLTAVVAVMTAVGVASAGGDVLTPFAGTFVLGLFAMAIAGIGFAVGGIFRTSIAAEAAAVVAIVTFLIDLVVPALKLPDWVHQLALTSHLGQPMVGVWDVPGMAACLVLAFGGLLLGGWGIRRRDISR
jgi:ABC-2 type transport system permease protein